MKFVYFCLALALLLSGAGATEPKVSLSQLNLSQPMPANLDMGGHDFTNWYGFPGDNATAYDGIVKQVGSTFYGFRPGRGTPVSSGSSMHTAFNGLVNSLVPAHNATIIIDAPTGITTGTCYMYDYLEVVGINSTSISTSSDIDIFKANQTTSTNEKMVLKDIDLLYTGSADYSHYHVALYNPTKCIIENVKMSSPNLAAYDANQKGGLLMSANLTGCWLNYVEKCDDLFGITLENISDSWIRYNTISNFNLAPYAIILGTNCNDNKILYNHIICGKLAGIYNTAVIGNCQFIGNYFEPQNGVSASDEFGIYANAGMYRCLFQGNHFVVLGACGMHFPQYLDYSQVIGNNYYNLNWNNNGDYADFRVSAAVSGHGIYNTIMGNVHYNDHSTTKSAAIMETNAANDPNYNIITSNTIKGSGYAFGVVKVGAQSITTGANIETLS